MGGSGGFPFIFFSSERKKTGKPIMPAKSIRRYGLSCPWFLMASLAVRLAPTPIRNVSRVTLGHLLPPSEFATHNYSVVIFTGVRTTTIEPS